MSKPLVSVLMPTRERPKMAKESVESLGEGDFEVLLYIDDDDPNILEYKDYKLGKYVIEPRQTYVGFHKMVNKLAEKAKGDWLFLWNDDAYMRTPWIDKIKPHDPNKAQVLTFYPLSQLDLFPIMSRKMYDIQGYYSQSPHCDSWAMDIANKLGCHIYLPDVFIEHKRDHSDLQDATKDHTVQSYDITIPMHGSPEVQGEMNKMIEKLRSYV